MNTETPASKPNLYGTASQLLHRIAARELPGQVLKRRRQYRPRTLPKMGSLMGTLLNDLRPLGESQE